MDKTYLGRRLANFSPGIASQPITKVELLDENGDVVGVSGSDTGRTLTALQPDGTDAMAAAILAKVSGYKHIGYEGRKARVLCAAYRAGYDVRPAARAGHLRAGRGRDRRRVSVQIADAAADRAQYGKDAVTYHQDERCNQSPY